MMTITNNACNDNKNDSSSSSIRLQRDFLIVLLILSFLCHQVYDTKNCLTLYTTTATSTTTSASTITIQNENDMIQKQHQPTVAASSSIVATDADRTDDNTDTDLQKITSYSTASTMKTPTTTTITTTNATQDPKSSSSASIQLLNGTKYPSLIQRFIVVPEYKTLFCYVEKVGCTMFNDIFRLLRMLHLKKNHTPTTTGGANTPKEFKFQGRDTWWRNTPEHHKMSLEQIEDILTHREDWTKAVFYRDPATRFLSFYRSKCEPPMEDRGSHCYDVFGLKRKGRPNKLEHPPIPFDRALDQVQADPTILNKDPHTIPMSEFCGGLSQSIQHYDMIEQITESSSPQTIGRLLGMMDNVTPDIQQGIVECLVERKSCDYLRQRLPEYNTYPVKPNSTQLGKGSAHYTGTNRGNTLEENFKTDDRLKIIQDAYQQDYDLFNITKLSLQGIHEAGVR